MTPLRSSAASWLFISVEHVKEAGVLVEINERLGRQTSGHVCWPDDWPGEDRPSQLVEQLEVICSHKTPCQCPLQAPRQAQPRASVKQHT